MPAVVTPGTANTTSAGTFDVTIPAHSAGDELVVQWVKIQTSSASPTVSTGGWTSTTVQPTGTATLHIGQAWKTGDGSETTVRITNMSGGTVIGKVYKVTGSDAATVGTPSYDTSTATTTADLDVGTVVTGDVGFFVCGFANTTSSPSLDNGYTLDVSNANYLMGYKVTDSTDESVPATWTPSRHYRAALTVLRATVTAGVPRVMFHRRMQGMA